MSGCTLTVIHLYSRSEAYMIAPLGRLGAGQMEGSMSDTIEPRWGHRTAEPPPHATHDGVPVSLSVRRDMLRLVEHGGTLFRRPVWFQHL